MSCGGRSSVSDSSSVPNQRRDAVRAHVRVPVVVTLDGERRHGTTSDLSEGGAACVLPLEGDPPSRGSELEVMLVLDTRRVWLDGVVLNVAVRGRARLVTVRFTHPSESDRNQVRRHVFASLRRDRARGYR